MLRECYTFPFLKQITLCQTSSGELRSLEVESRLKKSMEYSSSSIGLMVKLGRKFMSRKVNEELEKNIRIAVCHQMSDTIIVLGNKGICNAFVISTASKSSKWVSVHNCNDLICLNSYVIKQVLKSSNSLNLYNSLSKHGNPFLLSCIHLVAKHLMISWKQHHCWFIQCAKQ